MPRQEGEPAITPLSFLNFLKLELFGDIVASYCRFGILTRCCRKGSDGLAWSGSYTRRGRQFTGTLPARPGKSRFSHNRSSTLAEKIYEVVHSLPDRIRVRLQGIRHDQALAAGLESLLHAQDGVRAVRTNPDCASVTITFTGGVFDPIAWLDRLSLADVRPLQPGQRPAARPLNPLAALRRATFAFETLLPPKGQFGLSALALLCTVLELPALVTGSALLASLLPVINRAAQTTLEEGRLGADALDGGTCLVLIQQKSFLPASLMLFLIASGELLRDVVTSRCHQLITHQRELSQRSAWLVQGYRRVRVPVIELRPGDQVVVYPGELVAVEGTIVRGEGTIVPASPEMDFEPRYVRAGDNVTADTLLTEGKLYIRNETGPPRPAADPVRQKQKRRWLQRTRLHKLSLRMAYDAVAPLLSIAAVVLVATRDLERAMALVCFDFLTGIKIAIPTAVLSSMYKAGRRGIVMRNASALEALAEIDAVIFARSGTLTALKPTVTEVFVCPGYSLEEVTRMAAAAEQRYSHLVAYAIYSYAHLKSIPVPERTASDVIAGLGVKGQVEGHAVLVGSTRLMQLEGIDLSAARAFLEEWQAKGDSRACVAIDGKLAGVIAYRDPLRPDARATVRALKRMGIKEIAMMTGGGEAAAGALAEQAGIATVHSRTLPQDQAQIVADYRRRGLRVAVVGQDVEDSPALEEADVAIALGTGSDVARHRADILLATESLTGLVEGIRIAREGMELARQNLLVVSVPNVLGLTVSLVDQTDFVTATVLNNGSVVLGAANGLRPLLDKPGRRGIIG